MIITNTPSGPKELPPAGPCRAVCVRVIDLGMQPGYEGKPQHKCRLMVELEHRYTEGERAGKRFLMSEPYTASMNEKAKLRKALEDWRGKTFTEQEAAHFDTSVLNGKPMYVNILHKELPNGNTIAVISAFMPFPKGMEPLTQETPMDYMPEWIQKIIDGRLDK